MCWRCEGGIKGGLFDVRGLLGSLVVENGRLGGVVGEVVWWLLEFQTELSQCSTECIRKSTGKRLELWCCTIRRQLP